MYYLKDDMGHHFPVDIVSAQVDQDGFSEFTVRTRNPVSMATTGTTELFLHYPRCNGKTYLERQNMLLTLALQDYEKKMKGREIKKVIFNDPATIVLWNDGTKTVVKCQEGDEYSKEKGLALCIAKKHLGNKSNFNNEFKRWING